MSYIAGILPGMTQRLPSRWEGIEDRVPDSLDDLRGPADGTLTLPPELCWSGINRFDLGNYRHRLSAYRIVLTTGHRADAERLLHARHLVTDWRDQRRMLGPQYRRAWESRFPELTATTTASAG